jgi:hypothetical protein
MLEQLIFQEGLCACSNTNLYLIQGVMLVIILCGLNSKVCSLWLLLIAYSQREIHLAALAPSASAIHLH